MERLAAPPSRATGNITMSFGLIVIPLSVYTGQSDTRVSRKEFVVGTDVPVGRNVTRKDTGEVIGAHDVERRAQATSGAWVGISTEEIEQATMPKGQAEIIAQVPLKEMGNYLLTEVRQVRPKTTKGQVDPAVAKAWALLSGALRKAKVALLIRAAMRGPAGYFLLTADGDLFTVAPADSIREPLPPTTALVTPAEANLAKALLETIPTEVPVVLDDTAGQIQAFVDAKAKGAPAPVYASTAGTPEDLQAALTASLAAAKAKRQGKEQKAS